MEGVNADSPSAREVLLVGSVGLKDSEEVFRTVGPLLGDRMKRIPDGETGLRTSWVSRLRFVLEDNPSFEDDPQEVAAGGRITHPTEGTRTWKGSGVIVRGAPPPPRMRLKAGVRPEEIRSAGSVIPKRRSTPTRGFARCAIGASCRSTCAFRFRCRLQRRS